MLEVLDIKTCLDLKGDLVAVAEVLVALVLTRLHLLVTHMETQEKVD